jgi:hypothetical protein
LLNFFRKEFDLQGALGATNLGHGPDLTIDALIQCRTASCDSFIIHHSAFNILFPPFTFLRRSANIYWHFCPKKEQTPPAFWRLALSAASPTAAPFRETLLRGTFFGGRHGR